MWEIDQQNPYTVLLLGFLKLQFCCVKYCGTYPGLKSDSPVSGGKSVTRDDCDMLADFV